jgi:hypothetical protein
MYVSEWQLAPLCPAYVAPCTPSTHPFTHPVLTTPCPLINPHPLQITANRSLDGVLDTLNSRHLTDAGPLQLIDDAPEDPEVLPPGGNPAAAADVPGAPRKRPVARTAALALAPTGVLGFGLVVLGASLGGRLKMLPDRAVGRVACVSCAGVYSGESTMGCLTDRCKHVLWTGDWGISTSA